MSDPNAGLILILRRTQPWIYFLSTFGFVMAALIAVLGSATLSGMTGDHFERETPLVAFLIYVVLFVVWLVPSFYLNKYALRVRTFLAQGHRVQLEAALETQRRFWVLAGVAAIVLGACTVLAVIMASS